MADSDLITAARIIAEAIDRLAAAHELLADSIGRSRDHDGEQAHYPTLTESLARIADALTLRE